MRKLGVYSLVLTFALIPINVLSQSGGTFVIEKSVIGSGGQSSGGAFVLDATAGQPVAGTTSVGGAFELTSGFWGGGGGPVNSTVSVSGRVFTPDNVGLRNATVKLTDQFGSVRNVTTNLFGLYTFDNITPGQVYTMSVLSKKYRFASRLIAITSNLTNIDFVGVE